MSASLVKSISIDNLLNQREALRVRLLRAHDALEEADRILTGMVAETVRHRLYWGVAQLVTSRGDSHAFTLLKDDGVAKAMREFDALAWHHLLQASGLRTFMDAEARQKWDKGLDKGDYPDLNLANIEATFSQLYESRGDMFERGVLACFRRLAWDYKTNLPQKFGKRIVMRGITGTYGNQACNELDDMVRVFHVMDGKPEPDHRQGTYSKLFAAGLNYGKTGRLDAEYYSLRTFKNQNAHVTFKRMDLVEQMNRILAKHFPNALAAPK